MSGKGIIEHRGRVDHSDGNRVYVKIQAESACASCKLTGVCGMDTREKIIEVDNITEAYQEGDKVSVGITEKLGYKALFYAYLLSFLIGLITLLISMGITGREGLSALISLASVGLYYLALTLFRDHLKKSFRFILNKTNQ
ncbi:MAG: SoxR reducing system RseC family protein [Bacteroidota bacterium]